MDTDYYTVKEAIENKSYKENECWINSLNEHYEGTELMREKRGKLAKTLSREKVLELIKMSDDEYIEKGATINQMENVFQHLIYPLDFITLEMRSSTDTILKQEPAKGLQPSMP